MPIPSSGLADKRTAIGVDQQGTVTVAVKAERTRQGIVYQPLPTPPAASDPDTPATLTAGALSPRESLARWLDAPLASVAKARRVLPSLLDIQLPFAVEDCACAFLHVTPTPEHHVRALAIAARLKDVEAACQRFTASGWDPHILDHEGLALWTQSLRDIPPRDPDVKGCRAVLYLGVERWTLVLGHGHRFLSCHAVRVGDDAHIVRVLKAARAETPAIEAQTPLLRLWTGPGATGDNRLDSDLEARLAAAWPGPSETHKHPQTFLARALATRALTTDSYPCNLRTGPLTHPDIHARDQRRQAAPAWTTLAAGLLLVAASIATHMGVRHRETRSEHRFATMRDAMLGYTLPVTGDDALTQVRSALESSANANRPFARFFAPSLLDRIPRVLAACRQTDMRLVFLNLEDDHIVLQGDALDWRHGEALASLVETMGYTVTLDREPARDDGRIPWTITSRTTP